MVKQKIKPEDSKRHYEYYKKKFPDKSIEECQEMAKYFRKSTSCNCIEYYIQKYPDKSEKECKQLLSEHFANKRKTDVRYKEYWMSKYPEKTKEECEELANKIKREGNYQCIEYWIKRYPNNSLEECQIMLANKKKDYLSKRPDNHGINNPMHHSRVSIEKIKEGSPMCIEFYRKRYPELPKEEQEKLWRESCNKRTIAVKNSIKTTNIEYYINQGMSIKDAKKALHDRQCTFSLEKCIEKYGEEKGKDVYQKRQIKWINSLQNHFKQEKSNNKPYFQSSLQHNIFNELKKIFPDIEEEYYLFDNKENKGFSYDIRYGNKLIEVNGDYWHANPKLYDDTFFNKKLQKTAKEIWNNDKLKQKVAKKNKMKIMYIWESNYNENPKGK